MPFLCEIFISFVDPNLDGIFSNNPNGWDPFFNWTIVRGNYLLEAYNVTYQDLINKPMEAAILGEEIFIRSQELGNLCIDYGNKWVILAISPSNHIL